MKIQCFIVSHGEYEDEQFTRFFLNQREAVIFFERKYKSYGMFRDIDEQRKFDETGIRTIRRWNKDEGVWAVLYEVKPG